MTEYLTIKEVAEIVRLKPATVRKMIYRGQLKAFRPSPNKMLVPKQAIVEMIESWPAVEMVPDGE